MKIGRGIAPTAVVVIVVIAVVVIAGVSAAVLLAPKEEVKPKEVTYALFYDYGVGEYYNYEMTMTTTEIKDNMESETSYTSASSMQITAVEDNEITAKHIGTEFIAGENVDVTLVVKMSNKGKMISWEIENVAPPEYWEAAEAHENICMVYWELLGLEFPEEAILIGHKWESPIEAEIPLGPIIIPITGVKSAHFVGKESITVKAGIFDCWRIDYDGSISGGLTDVFTINSTYTATSWFNKQNCAQIKWTLSGTSEYDGIWGYSEMIIELVEYGTI